MEAVLADKKLALKNLLFTTDFSEPSRNALPWALALARRYGATLHVVHVVRPIVYPVGPAEAVAVPFDNGQYAQGLMRQLQENLQSSLQGVNLRTWVLDAEIDAALEETIAQNKIDWIILGTHGRTGVRKLLLGSIAEQVLRITHIPALTLGPHILHSPALDVDMKKILCVVDFSSLAERALAYAFSLAQEYQSRLTLLHVVRGFQEVPESERTYLRGKFERLLRDMAPAEADLWCEPEFVVELGERDRKILDSAAYRGSDLIVQSLVPGLSRDGALEVIRQATCPVLTIHS